MLRTEEAIVEVVSRDWSNLTNMIKQRIVETFQTCPHYFFTEHDIHSVLYNITNEELQLSGVFEEKTSDEYQVSMVHHEYPTPFRCDMKGYNFEKKDRAPYKRGHYDLVVFNPDFVRDNELRVVCGKDYQKLRSAMRKVKVEPLIWACEVIFFPAVKKLPKNAFKIIKQDALKVKETLRHKVGQNINFCKVGSVLVFTSHTSEEASNLKLQITALRKKHELEVTLLTT